MPWSTNRFDRSHSVCAGVFDTFTRDVDFSPDGSYYVVTTTGAFAGGANANTMCDSSSRWETNQTGNDPTWITYTGGDTTFGLAVTGAAVYVGGHMRWENNPFQGDQAGPSGARPGHAESALGNRVSKSSTATQVGVTEMCHMGCPRSWPTQAPPCSSPK